MMSLDLVELERRLEMAKKNVTEKSDSSTDWAGWIEYWGPFIVSCRELLEACKATVKRFENPYSDSLVWMISDEMKQLETAIDNVTRKE